MLGFLTSPEKPVPKRVAYDSRQIANWFIERAERERMSLSIMKLIKIVYMAHGWCMAALNRPLISDEVQAWEYGPVIPEIYYAFRKNGIHELSPLTIYEEERELEPRIEQLLGEVWNIYKKRSALELSNLTHITGGPWDQAYVPNRRFNVIPNDSIAKHYRAKLKKAQNG